MEKRKKQASEMIMGWEALILVRERNRQEEEEKKKKFFARVVGESR